MHDECLRMGPAPQNCWGLSLGRSVQWLASIADYAKAIPYKWMSFRYLVPDCPSGDCWFTVTLCDTCLERSALGNIMFGYAAKHWGWDEFTAHMFPRLLGALSTEWDRAAAGIGYYIAEEYNGVSSSETMCDLMKAQEGGLSFPEAYWENIQMPCAEKCGPCTTSVPASLPHTRPAFADEPTGHSPFAGAPATPRPTRPPSS